MSDEPRKDATKKDAPEADKPKEEITPEEVRRLLAADWFESFARLIRDEKVFGCQLDWDGSIAQPTGQVVVSAKLLTSPLAALLQAALEKAEAVQKPIPSPFSKIEDYSNHKCSSPQCVICANPNKA